MIETILIVWVVVVLGVVWVRILLGLVVGVLRLAAGGITALGRLIMPRNPRRGTDWVFAGIACALVPLVLWWLV